MVEPAFQEPDVQEKNENQSLHNIDSHNQHSLELWDILDPEIHEP